MDLQHVCELTGGLSVYLPGRWKGEKRGRIQNDVGKGSEKE
jgi:hypothetical protein